jgi:hypothetical protein
MTMEGTKAVCEEREKRRGDRQLASSMNGQRGRAYKEARSEPPRNAADLDVVVDRVNETGHERRDDDDDGDGRAPVKAVPVPVNTLLCGGGKVVGETDGKGKRRRERVVSFPCFSRERKGRERTHARVVELGNVVGALLDEEVVGADEASEGSEENSVAGPVRARRAVSATVDGAGE